MQAAGQSAWRAAEPADAERVSRMGTDRNIRDEVHKELVSDPLIDADDIVIEVVNGAVSLTGTVPSQAQCAEAVAAAHRVAGVIGVDNLLAVALPSGDFGDDAARHSSRTKRSRRVAPCQAASRRALVGQHLPDWHGEP